VRVLLDTDVLLDVALERQPFVEASGAVLDWAERHPGRAVVAWHSLSNLAYMIRPDARPFIADLLDFAEVAPASATAARQALRLPLGDFEDALQVAAASAAGAACIVTRNVRDYRNSPVPAVTPNGFLARCG
jgi:predicted nucleic acid-binding protein